MGTYCCPPCTNWTLEALMERVVPEDVAAQEETWLLMDHFNFMMMSNLDTTPGVRISPQDLEGLASDKWQSVLSDHFFGTQKIDQGLGAIDPTAVCTQGNRLQGLSETTVGAIYVDEIFSGRDTLLNPDLTNDALLWEARFELPFLMFDNPIVNEPSVQRLVGLPDGEALYRVRWTVWSGWHLLWSLEPHEGQTRLSLKTGGNLRQYGHRQSGLGCHHRSSLILVDEFYPTEPARLGDKKLNDNYPSTSERQARKRAAKAEKNERNRAQIMTDVNTAVSRTQSTVGKFEDAVELVEGDTVFRNMMPLVCRPQMRQQKSNPDSTLTQLREIIDRKPATIDVSETVQYFRRLARMPFVEASREKGMLLFLHDFDQPETIGFLHDTVAHTPYARAHKLQGLKHIQGASWTVYFSKDPSVEKMAMVAPVYTPQSSYVAHAVVPSFRRPVTTDATFVADVYCFLIERVCTRATVRSIVAL